MIGPQTAQAYCKRASDIPLMSGRQTELIRRLRVCDGQRGVRNYICAAQLGKKRSRGADRLMLIACQIAACQFESERQVAKFLGNGCQTWIIGRKVPPMPLQKR